MKLEYLNRLDEVVAINEDFIIEGLFNDIVTACLTRSTRWLTGKDEIVKHLGLTNFVNTAKEITGSSLLDETPETDKWWHSLIAAIDKLFGSRTSKKRRIELVAKVKEKIAPSINKDREVISNKLPDNRETAKIMDILFGNSEKPKSKRRRPHFESKIYEEGLGNLVGNALDMLDPKKRLQKGVALVRASNNARIAAMAIDLISRQLESDSVGRKLRTIGKKPRAKKIEKATDAKVVDKIDRLYEFAKIINQAMRIASKQENRDKNEKYWLGVVNSEAKKRNLGMRPLTKLPQKPYPEDFEEFEKIVPNKYKPPLRRGEKVKP